MQKPEPVQADAEKEKLELFKEIDRARTHIASTLGLSSRDMQTREKYNQVTRIAYNHLLANGRFYFDKSKREGYWFDSDSKQLWKLESEKFSSFLSFRLDVNQKDAAFDWIMSGTRDRVTQGAAKVEPQTFSYFDETTSVLYINNKPGRMLRIGSDTIQETDNGDGALFLWDDDWEEFEYSGSITSRKTLKQLIYERHSLDISETRNLTTEDLGYLLNTYIQSILFRTIVLHRPLLAYIGPFGCGKTEMQRLIGITLFGRNYDVLGLEEQKQDAAIAYVTNSVFGTFDNADERLKWLPDLLARVVTRAKIPRRKLYTTNELVKYQVDCLLGITARSTPWARPDIISRLLIVRFKQPEFHVNEKKARQDVIDHRVELMAEIIENARRAIKKLGETESETFDSPSRLAGFYSFGMRISDDRERFDEAFCKVMQLQDYLAADEEETLVAVLKAWVRSQSGEKDVQGQEKEWSDVRTTSQLLGELVQVGKNNGMEFHVKTTSSLTRRIKENTTMLKSQKIIFRVDHGENGTEWQFKLYKKKFPKIRQMCQFRQDRPNLRTIHPRKVLTDSLTDQKILSTVLSAKSVLKLTELTELIDFQQFLQLCKLRDPLGNSP